MTKTTDVYCPACESEQLHYFYEQVVQCGCCYLERYYDADLLWQHKFAEEQDGGHYDHDDNNDNDNDNEWE